MNAAFQFLLVFFFYEKENSLETLIVIFGHVSPQCFSLLNMKDFEISVLTGEFSIFTDSRS